MPNITTLVYDLISQRRLHQDVKIVEHPEKPDRPQCISVMVYGGRVGLAVVTLELTDVWRISDIKSDSHYKKVQWPLHQTALPTNKGALELIDRVLESVVVLDEEKRA